MNQNESAFIKTFFYAISFILLIIISFSGFIDPYGIINSTKIEGLNSVKPKMFSNSRMVKVHGVRRYKPRGLILGSSRSEVGLDPEHWAWPEHAKPVYNSALPSARIFEVYQYLRHAHSQGNLVKVVLGIDFFMFDQKFISEPGFSTQRLDLEFRSFLNTGIFNDYLTALLSYDSLKATFETLQSQNNATFGYLENGSQDSRNRHLMVKNKGGHFAAFEASLKSSLLASDGLAAVEYIIQDGKRPESLNYFKEIIYFCLKNYIDLHIVISPVHAQWLEVLFQLNKWDQYENWKRDIVQIVDNANHSVSHKTKLELWDFSGFNEITKEAVPKKGDDLTEMQWYWEASHYQRNTGNLILDKILGKKVNIDYLDFGVHLYKNNIDEHLQKIQKDRIKYMNEFPDDISYIEGLIKSTMPLSKYSKVIK